MTLEEYLRDAPDPPGELIRLDYVEGQTTLVTGQILDAFKNDKRVMFLTPPGKSGPVLNRIRTRISGVRASMKAKGLLRFHYRMRSYVFPYTNSKGIKCDCVVLHKVVTRVHKITEIVEGVIQSGTVNSRVAGEAKTETNRVERIEW
jgi:hypothetical protein